MLIKYPDPILEQKSAPVTAANITEAKNVAAEMLQCMNQFPTCVGFSAVQLGVLLRLTVVLHNPYSETQKEPMIIVNPRIVKASHPMVRAQEGCLSIGNGQELYWVERHKTVKVRGRNLDGKEVVLKGSGILSCVLQHEIDHLDGIMINQKGVKV